MLTTALRAGRASLSRLAREIVRSPPANPLDGRDSDFIRATLPTYRALMRLYFRPKVRGLENVPAEGPVLLVGNHSGGTLIVDTFAFTFAFYSYFGAKRRFHQLAHDLVFSLPGLGALRNYGTMSASPENAERALDAEAALLVYPGGGRESFRPSWSSSQIEFEDRTGFIRLALAKNVPIVPVVAIGGQETALFLTRGRRLAKLLQLDRLLRLDVLPIQLGPPFGLTVLDLPGRVPLPSQITIQVLPKLALSDQFGPRADEASVYEAITEQMQQALEELAGERDLPVVGSLRARSGESGAVATALASDRIAGAVAQDREPWAGYAQSRVGDVTQRLRRQTNEALAAVHGYEQAHRQRKGVLSAIDRERARRNRQ